MPREIITVQLGQCGNQSKCGTVIYAEFEEIMKERERERERERGRDRGRGMGGEREIKFNFVPYKLHHCVLNLV